MTVELCHILQIGGVIDENSILSFSPTTVICFNCLGESKICKNEEAPDLVLWAWLIMFFYYGQIFTS